jgi:hypothetical protein
MKVEFWGGPKDGDSFTTFGTPTQEFICMDETESPIDIIKFYKEIKDHPMRTQKYHKYCLKIADKPKSYLYVYSGLL